jgi:aryl-alcohol dehydrogenase-like predicted oxidoreductase
MLVTRNNSPLFKIALGGAGIGSDSDKIFFGKAVSESQAAETVLYALENGINILDTSPFYGSSEKKIGIALKEFKKRESVFLSTKAGTHPQHKGYSSDIFEKSIELSLKTLGTDYLDAVHIHDPTEADLKTAMAKNGGLETLLKLKEQGVIRHIGLGVRDHSLHSAFIASGFADIIMPYLDYNILRQSASGLIDYAKKKNTGVFMASALCMGLLSGEDPKKINISHYNIGADVSPERAQEMYSWCKTKEVNITALNFQFILRNSGIKVLVAGASSSKEIEKNLKAYHSPYNNETFNLFLQRFNIEKK